MTVRHYLSASPKIYIKNPIQITLRVFSLLIILILTSELCAFPQKNKGEKHKASSSYLEDTAISTNIGDDNTSVNTTANVDINRA